MARPRNIDPPIEKKVSLRSSLVAKAELLLFDPVRGKTRTGAWSELINQLLEEWINKQQIEEKDT